MLPWSIVCIECGELRIGTKQDGDIVPLQKECPDCGETEFNVPARDED